MILANYRRTPSGAMPQFVDLDTMTIVEGPQQASPALALAWCHSDEGQRLAAILQRVVAA